MVESVDRCEREVEGAEDVLLGAVGIVVPAQEVVAFAPHAVRERRALELCERRCDPRGVASRGDERPDRRP